MLNVIIRNIFKGERELLEINNIEMESVFHDNLKLETCDIDRELHNLNLELEEGACHEGGGWQC